jgi:hypothetical protein
MKIAEVYWRDSRMFITQCGKDEDFSVCDMHSVGFVISQDEDKIVLTGDLVDDEYRRVLIIPKENIVNLYIYETQKNTKAFIKTFVRPRI